MSKFIYFYFNVLINRDLYYFKILSICSNEHVDTLFVMLLHNNMKISKCCNKNDQQALNVLKKHSKGLTAYRLLSELQKTRNVKPMTIYSKCLKNNSA